MHIWKGSFHKMFACIRTWRQQKTQNNAMPPGIPDSSPLRARFHPRFAHVSPTFRNGSFFCFRCLRWFGPWHNSLEFTALGMECKVLRQFQVTIQVTLGTAASTSGSLSAQNLGIYSISGSRLCVHVWSSMRNMPWNLQYFRGLECMESGKL